MRKDIKFSNLARRRKTERFREHAYFNPTGCWGGRARALDGAPRAPSALSAARHGAPWALALSCSRRTQGPGAGRLLFLISSCLLWQQSTPKSLVHPIGMGLESGVPHSQSPTSHFQIAIADGSQHSLVISSLSYPVFVRFF